MKCLSCAFIMLSLQLQHRKNFSVCNFAFLVVESFYWARRGRSADFLSLYRYREFELFPIYISRQSPCFLLTSPAQLCLASRLLFARLHLTFFITSHEKLYIFVRLCGSNGKMNLHVQSYVYARLKNHNHHTTMLDLKPSFSPSIWSPIADWQYRVERHRSKLRLCLIA